MSLRACASLLVLAPLVPLASAADLRVEVAGALAPGNCQVQVRGDPGRPFSLYISATEAPTPLRELIVLEVAPIRQFAAGVELRGVLDAAGAASYSFVTTAALTGGRLSFQAASFTPSAQVSNLCRALYLAPDSFGTLGGGALSALGELFPLGDGRLALLGGSGPLSTLYDPCRQETQPGPLLPNSNLFAARAQLADGRVLVCGGFDTAGQVSSEAYLYDASGRAGTLVASLATPRAGATATRLPSGRVLVCGGLASVDLTDPLAFFDGLLGSCELFDPATLAFVPGPSLPERKAFASATLLSNNQVLVAGGLAVLPIVNLPYVSNLAYTYSSTTGSFSPLPKVFSGGRLLHSATRLSDNRVLIAGGIGADLTDVLSTGDLSQIAFDALATTAVYSTSGLGSFSVGPTLKEGRALHAAAALPGGRLLAAGGFTGTLDLGDIATGVFELPEPLDSSVVLTTTSARTGPSMAAARAGASAAVLPSGRALILGGGPLSIEVYQP